MSTLASIRPKSHAFERFLATTFPDRRLRRVLLVKPPDAPGSMFRFDVARRHRVQNYPPYGLMILGRRLQHLGIEAKISNLHHVILEQCHACETEDGFDPDAIARNELQTVMREFEPDLICITCMFTMTHPSFVQTCQVAIDSGIPVAVGGVHVSNNVDRVVNDLPGLKLVFLREADNALDRFVRAVRGELDSDSLGQLIALDGGRRHTFSANVAVDERDVDITPAYDLFDVATCANVGGIGAFFGAFAEPGSRFSCVLGNRGCRAQCTFCSVRSYNGKGVRQRPVESVLDELQYLEEHHGINHITWLDDDLLKDERRAVSLFDGMVRRGLSMSWDAMNGVIAASCTQEMCAAMAASRCIALNIGMESGNPRILREIRKPGTVEVFLEAARQLREQPSIHAAVYLMIGFPGETWRMINDTIDVAREMDLDWYRISTLQPLPNTPIYQSMVAAGMVVNKPTTELRFMGGSFGRARDYDSGKNAAHLDFESAFRNISLDSPPTPSQLSDIWFYMHYHLNFQRLFSEDRPQKIDQLSRMVRHLRDVVCPENALAQYFDGYLQFRKFGNVQDDVVQELRTTLSDSEYWSARFSAFGLSARDLETGEFRVGEAPRLRSPGSTTLRPRPRRMEAVS